MTDADDLPEGWALATMEQLCELNPKHSSSLKGTTEVSFVPMAAVSDTDGRIIGSEIRPYIEVKKGYTHFADGDVIFAKITPCMENGKAASVRGLKNGVACGTTEFFVFRSRGAINQDYLFNFIRQESYRKAARATMQSGVGQARVPKEFVLNTEIPLPPLAEQKRIVARLEALQARSRNAREALAEVPALLEQYRQSVLAAAFRGDLTAAWREQNLTAEPAAALLERIRTERRKQWEAKCPKKTYIEPERVDDSDLPELPEGWCWASIEEISDIGGGLTRNQSARAQGLQTAALVTVAAVQLRSIRVEGIRQIQLVDSDGDKGKLLRGDVLVVEGNGSRDHIGRVALWDEAIPEARHQNHLIRIRPHEIDSRYVLEWLASPLGRLLLIDAATTTAGLYNLSISKLSRISIPLSPISEQGEILRLMPMQLNLAARIELQTVATNLDLSHFDQSLLAQAFRGELVEQDPSDEPAAAMLARLQSGTSLSAPAIKQPLRIQDVVHDLILLLRTFNKPMERAALELGLVLMLNDDARTSILDKTATPGRAKATGRSYLEGLDHLLGDLAQAKRWIKITTGVPQMITLTTQAPSTDQADALARRRVQETLKVMAAVKKERLPAVVEKICHAAYELVSSS